MLFVFELFFFRNFSIRSLFFWKSNNLTVLLELYFQIGLFHPYFIIFSKKDSRIEKKIEIIISSIVGLSLK